VLFTASEKVYADECVRQFDPKGEFFAHRLYRQHCTRVVSGSGHVLVKDLSRLGRDLSHTIIVDNSIHCFAYQLTSGVPISSYYGQRNDTELLMLTNLLKTIVMEAESHPQGDVRTSIDRIFGITSLIWSTP